MAPNTNKYRPRIVDQQIERMLPMIGAIQIKGPEWCGKTTTAERHAKSVLRLHDPLDPKDCEEVARLNLGILLEGKHPASSMNGRPSPRSGTAQVTCSV